MEFDELSNKVIGCALEVHKNLGPGLLESTYQQCLAYELKQAGINFKMEVEMPVKYKSVNIDCGYRADILVENKIILELKSVEKLHPIHEAQILAYMKLSGIGVGFLMNFNVKLFKNGLKRFVI